MPVDPLHRDTQPRGGPTTGSTGPAPCLNGTLTSLLTMQRDRWNGARIDREAALEVFGADEVHYASEVQRHPSTLMLMAVSQALLHLCPSAHQPPGLNNCFLPICPSATYLTLTSASSYPSALCPLSICHPSATAAAQAVPVRCLGYTSGGHLL